MTSLKRNARQIQFTGDPTDITGRLGKKKDIFYRLKLARSSDIALTLNGIAAKANVDLFLLNRKNRVLSKSTKPGNAPESISASLKPGEYLIHVLNKRNKAKTNYQLKISTAASLTAPTPTPSGNSAPAGEVKSLTVQRGQVVPLKLSSLGIANRASSDQRYVITQTPRNGFLQLDGKPLAMGQSFSQTDLEQGRVTYRGARAGASVIGNGSKPLVSGFNMIWQGPGGSDGGSDNEIFFSDGTTVRQLTQNSVDDKVLGISGNHIVWASQIGAANSQGVATYELFESNGVTTNRLTNNAVNEEFVGVDGEHLFWTSPIGPLNQYGYPTHEVFYAKNGAVRQLTNNSVDESVSDFEAGTAVWEAALGPVNAGRATSEVYYFNGSGVQQITNNNVDDLSPRLDNGRIVWSSRIGVSEVGAPSTEVMLFDGASIRQITFNNTDDFVSDIKGNQVAWMSRSGPFNGMGLRTYELFRFDGATTQRLTTNATDESLVDISGSNLLWMGGGPADASGRGTIELFLFNGSQTIQITRNQADDVPVGIFGSKVVWSSRTGAIGPQGIPARKVFYFDGTSAKPLTNDARNDDDPSFSDTTIAWASSDGASSQIVRYDLGDEFSLKLTNRQNQAGTNQVVKINFV